MALISRSFSFVSRPVRDLKSESGQKGDALQEMEVELCVRRCGGADHIYDLIGGRLRVFLAVLGVGSVDVLP